MRRLVTAAAACAALAVPAPAGALPNADVGVVQGSGTLSGWSDLGRRDIAFSGTATLVGTDGLPATYSCSFRGWVEGGLVADVGLVSGTCGPFPLDLCAYARASAAVSVDCAGTGPATAFAAAGVYRPHNVLPTSSFDLTLAVTGLRVPVSPY